MRASFPGYYPPSDEDLTKLWAECTFIPDANVLLSLYCYRTETRDELAGIFGKIADRIWIPHQIALEYHEERIKVIEDQIDSYNRLVKLLKQSCNELREYKHHPFISENLVKELERVTSQIREEIKGRKKTLERLISEDTIGELITELFEGKIGPKYSAKKLRKIYRKGEIRYQRFQPPGFEDAWKGGTRQYGDLVLWFQIVDKAKEQVPKPVIFVTNDLKDDWWISIRGQKIPHPALIQEIHDKTGVSFYMYALGDFLENARKYLNVDVAEDAIEEVREVQSRQLALSVPITQVTISPESLEQVREMRQSFSELTQRTSQVILQAMEPSLSESMRRTSQLILEAMEPSLSESMRRTSQITVPLRSLEELSTSDNIPESLEETEQEEENTDSDAENTTDETNTDPEN